MLLLLACATPAPVVSLEWHQDEVPCADGAYVWAPPEDDIAGVMVHIVEPRESGQYDAWLNTVVLEEGSMSWECESEDGRLTILYATAK